LNVVERAAHAGAAQVICVADPNVHLVIEHASVPVPRIVLHCWVCGVAFQLNSDPLIAVPILSLCDPDASRVINYTVHG